MKYRVFSILFFTGALLGTTGVGKADGQDFRYSGSIQYATGSYFFTERTSSFYFNNGLGITGDGFGLYVNIPLITQSTPWVSYSSTGIGPLPTGGPSHGKVDNSIRQGQGRQMGKRKVDPGSTDSISYTTTNIGDPSLSGNIKLYSSSLGNTAIHGNFAIKPPIADPSSGFGTGGWDFGAGLSWTQRVGSQSLIMFNSMYWQLGDMDDLNFHNILSYSASFGQSLQDGKLMAIANFFGSTRIIDDVDPPINVGAGLNYQVSPSTSLNTNLLIGLTESASDFALGLGWSFKF